MRLSENRVLAWIVLAVCVLGSVFGLGGGSLARERNEIVQVFYEGAEDRDSGHSMNAYLERMFDNARIMALEVQLYLGEDHAKASRVLECLNSYEPDADEDFRARGEIYKELRFDLVDYMYNDMYGANLTDAQRVDFKAAYDDFQGAVKFIEKDPYAELARKFNGDVDGGFLAGIVSKIYGLDSLWTAI